MSKIKIFTAALLALSPSAFAQVQLPPSTGGQIQQIPPAPVLQKALPEIRIEQAKPAAVPVSDLVKILIKSLHVTGQTVYSEAELIAITGLSLIHI